MSAKKLYQWFFITALAGIIALLIIEIAPVQAQCGDLQPSSCAACHAQEDPVNEKGEWHIIHASKDICINCHGGNGKINDKDLAHEGLTKQPLNDIYTDCHCCHPDYDDRAARFAPTLGVTPGSCATPTPIPIGNISSEPPSGSINISTELTTSASSSQPFWIIGIGFSVLTLFLFGVGWLAGTSSHKRLHR
jgi:hypothetical protein